MALSYSRFMLISRCLSTQAPSSEQSVRADLIDLEPHAYAPGCRAFELRIIQRKSRSRGIAAVPYGLVPDGHRLPLHVGFEFDDIAAITQYLFVAGFIQRQGLVTQRLYTDPDTGGAASTIECEQPRKLPVFYAAERDGHRVADGGVTSPPGAA